MTGIDEMFEDLAGQAAPPTRLTAAELYEAGRRRHRWQRRARVGTMVTGGVAAFGIWAATLAGPGLIDAQRWAGSPSSPAGGGNPGGIVWAGAADAAHLYATVADCPAADGTEACDGRLLGSDDGGRTWTERSREVLPEGPLFAGAQTLFTFKEPGKEAQTGLMPNRYNMMRPLLSTDGGRTWSELAKTVTPAQFVPAGSLLICYHDDEAGALGTFKPYVVDLTARRVAPLAQQPNLRSGGCAIEIPGLWYTGWENTTQADRPAVAYSKDSGRTWNTHVFDCTCSQPELYSNDGQTVYAAMAANSTRHPSQFPEMRTWSDLRMFRSLDGGTTWEPFALPEPPVPAPTGGPLRWTLGLLTDGSFAAHSTADGAWWILSNGTWERLTITGLPDTLSPRMNADGGLYLAYGPGSYDIHLSTDWRTWTRIPVS